MQLTQRRLRQIIREEIRSRQDIVLEAAIAPILAQGVLHLLSSESGRKLLVKALRFPGDLARQVGNLGQSQLDKLLSDQPRLSSLIRDLRQGSMSLMGTEILADVIDGLDDGEAAALLAAASEVT
jgi:hypothetical protein